MFQWKLSSIERREEILSKEFVIQEENRKKQKELVKETMNGIDNVGVREDEENYRNRDKRKWQETSQIEK